MRTIEQIFELDDKLFEIFQENLPSIAEFNNSSIIPKTGNVLLLFITKTNFIKEGIFELYESENLYGITILFRLKKAFR